MSKLELFDSLDRSKELYIDFEQSHKLKNKDNNLQTAYGMVTLKCYS